MKILASFFGVVCLASLLHADTIKLKNGNVLEGVILKDDADGVVIRLKFGNTTLTHGEIESIERTAPAPGAKPSRLASWERCYEALATRPWASDLHPSTATVIDKGILKFVPYISSRAGDYEFNIYGDPERPANLEIGIAGPSSKLPRAKAEGVALLAQLVTLPQDQEVLRSLDLGKEKDKKEAGGLVFQFEQEPGESGTPVWWLSIYDPTALDAARLSEKELETMTQAPPEKSSGSPGTTTTEPSSTKASTPTSPNTTSTTSSSTPPSNNYGNGGLRGYRRGRFYRPHLPKGWHPPGMPAPK